MFIDAHAREEGRVTVRTSWWKVGTAALAMLVAGASVASAAEADSVWPGGATATVADGSDVFGANLSGLSFESASVLWAVQNSPSKLYRLVPDGATWRPDTTGGWSSGKTLRYPTGSGEPDAEGVVVTPDGTYVITERDNKGSTSLPKVLRFDTSATTSALTATAEWSLTADLPAMSANAGPEAISWIPDTFLTAHGLRDEHTGAAYDPAGYAGHGSGLFFVGVETGSTVFAYALTPAGGYTRIATVPSGLAGVMDLEFEPATGHLWAACDDTCQGRTATLDLNAQGQFAATGTYSRPTGMANYNNEGFALAPACTAGHKPVIWSDDSNDDDHALRAGTLNCTGV
jgi:hypothetical protein